MGIGLTALVWGCHGIALKTVTARALDQLAVGIYLALGWVGLFGTGPLRTALAPSTLTLVGVGAAVYSIWRHLPHLGESALSDAWHGFVLVAATLPYAAVCDGVVIAPAS